MIVFFFFLSFFIVSEDTESIVMHGPVARPPVLEAFFVPDYSLCDADNVQRIIELGRLASGGGFPSEELVTAVAVSFAESNGKEDAKNSNRNGSKDSGLWQINSVHGYDDLGDPEVNARAAFEIWEVQGWTAWYAHTPRGGEYGSGKWFQHWLPLVECVLEPRYRIVYAY